MNTHKASAKTAVPNFRRLKFDELVKDGDFVPDGREGFELWEGLSGFRADAFVKAIYRRSKTCSTAKN